MNTVVTIGDMRRLEQAAVDSGAVTYDELMERAGAAVASVIGQRFMGTGAAVLVLCGNGNNGGDGYVIARLLREHFPQATIDAVRVCGPSVTELAAEKERRVTSYAMEEWSLGSCAYTLVVDAVYGIGFHGELSRDVCELFRAVSAKQIPVVAVDIPSGVHADSGVYDENTPSATVTVTFTAPKPAFAVPQTRKLLGEIIVADVGIDQELTDAYVTPVSCVSFADVKTMLPVRPKEGHKGTFGRLLSVCGSYGMAGAAMLSGKAALRMGVGLLHMALPNSIYPIVAGQLWEAVYHPIEAFDAEAMDAVMPLLENKTAVMIGCGLSQHPETQRFVRELLKRISVPTVLDADGLNAFSAHIVDLKAVKAPLVLTPHPAEAARLLGVDVKTIERDRPAAVKKLAKESGAVAVLKGHRTLIASPDGDVVINTTGNVGMATGGSGDVLCGMIASLLAQGVSPMSAAVAGVYLHGAAGDKAAEKFSQTSMLPTDIPDAIGQLLL